MTETETVDVSDDDEVFRGLPPATQQHYETVGALLVVKQSAFNDRSLKPSVDLRRLCPDEEPRSEIAREDGVLILVVEKIRGISVRINDRKGNLSHHQSADVRHQPVEVNWAHSQIEPKRLFESKSHFRS